MTQTNRYFAIVPAAGSGARFGSERPKQYLDLLGMPLLHQTLQALCDCPAIERVWVVLAPDDIWWRQFDAAHLGAKLETVYCGGATRADSVRAGLLAAQTALSDDDWVLVHDAARPCLSTAHVLKLIAEVGNDAVGGLLAIPVADTLKRGDGENRVAATLPRDGLWQAQTPQMFRYRLLQTVLQTHPGMTDEAGAVESAGFAPRLVAGDLSNLKVTYPADLQLAAAILRERKRGDLRKV